MASGFRHFEILGPRASLDRWLTTLQTHGACHLVDALRGLEGEEGIGRPAPTFDELQAWLIRAEAERALRDVEHVLPTRGRKIDEAADWNLEAGGVGGDRLAALRAETLGIAGRLRERLEGLRRAEGAVGITDALVAGLRVLAAEGKTTTQGRLLALPRRPGLARRARRRLRRAGVTALVGAGNRRSILWLPDDAAPVRESPAGAAEDVLSSWGAESIPWPTSEGPTDLASLRVTLEERRRREEIAETEARAALRGQVEVDGPRGRQLLDAIEDAEGRMRARQWMAATEHVVALRAYVRSEESADLRERMRQVHGEEVVIRPLPARDDTPTVPRRVARSPLHAALGLAPSRFSEIPMPSVLALFAPLAVAVAWSDMGGGLILLLAGALLSLRAATASARREAGWVGQVAGLVCLVLGIVAGRAFGAAGAEALGTDWAGVPGFDPILWAGGGWRGACACVLFVLGVVALLVSVWGVGLALAAWRAERVARARSLLVGALHFACVTGLACAALPPTMALHAGWWLAAGAIALVFLLAGPRHLLVGLGLDLLGVARLVALGGAAILLFQSVFASWVDPSLGALVLSPVAIVLGCLVVLADPAHLAMGVPYDIALGGRRFTRPFAPLRRQVRRLESA
jgi:hypothetical protein